MYHGIPRVRVSVRDEWVKRMSLPGGSGGMLHQKILKARCDILHSGAFQAMIFASTKSPFWNANFFIMIMCLTHNIFHGVEVLYIWHSMTTNSRMKEISSPVSQYPPAKKMHLKMLSANVVCCIYFLTFMTNVSIEANTTWTQITEKEPNWSKLGCVVWLRKKSMDLCFNLLSCSLYIRI